MSTNRHTGAEEFPCIHCYGTGKVDKKTRCGECMGTGLGSQEEFLAEVKRHSDWAKHSLQTWKKLLTVRHRQSGK